jgi:hypothetical protein
MTLYESADDKRETVRVWCEECKGSGTKEAGALTVRCNHCSGGYIEREIDMLYAIHHDFKKRKETYNLNNAVADAAVLRSLNELQILEGAAMVNQVARTIIVRIHKFYCGEKE